MLNTIDAKPTRARLGVLGFLCSLSLLTYLDRVCISRVQDDIRSDLKIDEIQMGLVFGAFAIGYGLFEVPGGWMGDVWGPRRVLTRIVLWWSVFTALTGCVWPFALELGPLAINSLIALLVVRFLFGCGEAGAYPNLSRVVGGWFPYSERGLAQGSIWMCARFGGAIAPLVIGRLTVALGGWRQAFWVLGGIGILWAVAFMRWFRDRPEEQPGCNAAERDLIRAGPYSMKLAEASGAHPMPPWGAMLGSVSMWAICMAAACVSFGWYFFPTWQPLYFKEVHGISPENSEVLTGLPFACGAFGALIGGWLSDWLVLRLGSRRWGRSLVGVLGFTGAGLCVACIGLTQTYWQAATLLCLAFFINDLAIPPIWAASTDIGGRYAGTVAGVMNMVGAVGAFLSPALTPVFKNMAAAGSSPEQRWALTFGILASAWFVGAVAWLFVNAGKPLVPPDVGQASSLPS